MSKFCRNINKIRDERISSLILINVKTNYSFARSTIFENNG